MAKTETGYKRQNTTGDVIVGLASSGKANYEAEYNSGIGSNGLTSARHDVLKKKYADAFPQTFEPLLPDNVVYIGDYDLQDSIKADGITTNVGKLLLSPTRTYAPVVKKLLDQHFEDIHGLVHCSGGGQTKCMKYLPVNMRIVKDDLFKPPVVFEIIQKASKSTFNEMYQVFNMGHRLEIFTTPAKANEIISIAKQFAIDAKVIGRAEKADNKELILKGSFGEIKF
jgi:phosphoribosylformylglycinamidine cyclo-ligase